MSRGRDPALWLALVVGVAGFLVAATGGYRDRWLWIVALGFGATLLTVLVRLREQRAPSPSSWRGDPSGLAPLLACIALGGLSLAWWRPSVAAAGVAATGVALGGVLGGVALVRRARRLAQRGQPLNQREWAYLYGAGLWNVSLLAMAAASLTWHDSTGTVAGRLDVVTALAAVLLVALGVIATPRRADGMVTWPVVLLAGSAALVVGASDLQGRPELTLAAVGIATASVWMLLQSLRGPAHVDRPDDGAPMAKAVRLAALHGSCTFGMVIAMMVDWVLRQPR